MQTKFVLEWDATELARAFGITESDVRLYFTDGRRVSFIIERRLVLEHPGWKLAPSEGAGYDLLSPDGGKWEVRSLTRGGVYFCPSYMVGSGRRYEQQGFLEKLNDIRGYILSDIEKFPSVPVFVVPSGCVRKWYENGRLGAGTKVGREKFLNELAPSIELFVAA
jgi:hypothetical protein